MQQNSHFHSLFYRIACSDIPCSFDYFTVKGFYKLIKQQKPNYQSFKYLESFKDYIFLDTINCRKEQVIIKVQKVNENNLQQILELEDKGQVVQNFVGNNIINSVNEKFYLTKKVDEKNLKIFFVEELGQYDGDNKRNKIIQDIRIFKTQLCKQEELIDFQNLDLNTSYENPNNFTPNRNSERDSQNNSFAKLQDLQNNATIRRLQEPQIEIQSEQTENIEKDQIIKDLENIEKKYSKQNLKAYSQINLEQTFNRNQKKFLNEIQNFQTIKKEKLSKSLDHQQTVKKKQNCLNISLQQTYLNKFKYNMIKRLNKYLQKEKCKQYKLTVNDSEQTLLISLQIGYLDDDQQYFQELNYYRLSHDFKLYQDWILEILKENNYQLGIFLTKGGEGEIFEGYRMCKTQKSEQLIFKIFYNPSKEQIGEQIQIMKLFEKNKNFVQLLDEIHTEKFSILVFKSCKASLLDELKMIIKGDIQFTKEKLFKMIFDLLDGLIQLRINNIIHFDIKPSNILITWKNKNIIADFGCSSKVEENKQIKYKGHTDCYAPKDQIESKQFNYRFDTFSLGKTFEKIIEVYQKVNKNESEQIIQSFKLIIQNQMVNSQTEIINSKTCLEIQQQFFQVMIENSELQFLEEYAKNIILLTKQNPQFYSNQHTAFFNNSQLQYLNQQLQIYKRLRIENVDTFNLYTKLSNCHTKRGENEDALQYSQQALETIQKIFKGDHPFIAISLQNIGYCYIDKEDYHNALTYLQKCLQIRKIIYNSSHVHVQQSQKDVNFCCQKLGITQNTQLQSQVSIKIQKSLITFKSEITYEDQSYQQINEFSQNQIQQISTIYKNQQGQIIEEEQKNPIQQSLQIDCNNQLQGNKQEQSSLLEETKRYDYYSIFQQDQTNSNYQKDISTTLQVISDNQIPIQQKNLKQNYKTEFQYSSQQNKALQQQIDDQKDQHLKKIELSSLPVSKNTGIQISQQNQKREFQEQEKNIQIIKAEHQLSFIEKYEQSMSLNSGQALQDILSYLKNENSSLQKNNSNYVLNSQEHFKAKSSNHSIGEDALKYELDLLEKKKQIFEQFHINMTSTLQKIGYYYHIKGDYKDSLKYQLDCLKRRELIHNVDIEYILNSLQNIGYCYECLKDFPKALDFYQKLLNEQQKLYQYYHPSIAKSFLNIGRIQIKMSQYKSALVSFQNCNNIKKNFQCGNLFDIEFLENIGLCYFYLEDYKQAQIYWQKIYIFQVETQVENSYITVTLQNLGEINSRMNHNELAQTYFKESLKRREQMNDKQNIKFSQLLLSIGLVERKLRNYNSAINYYSKTIELLNQFHPTEYDLLGNCLEGLGSCYYNIQNFNYATQYYNSALSLSQQIKNRYNLELFAAEQINNICNRLKQMQYQQQY